MASVELIRKFCIEDDPEKTLNKFNKMFKDRPDALKLTLKTIVSQVAEDKNVNRPKYILILSNLIKQNISRITSDEIMEMLSEALPQKGTVIVKRIQRISYALCLFAVVKSGIFRNDVYKIKDAVQKIIQIAENNICFRTACYKMTLEIMEEYVTDEDVYFDVFHAEVMKPLEEETYSNVDRLYLWLKLSTMYKHVTVPKELVNPLTKEFFTKFDQLLLEVTKLLPANHPILPLLADIDAPALIQIVSDLWIDDKSHKNLLSLAIASAIPYLESSEIIQFLKNTKLFETSLSTKFNEPLIKVLEKRILSLIQEGDDVATNVLIALLAIPGQHSFVIKIINDFCSKMNNAQSNEILKHVNEMSFDSILNILWAQRHRESVTDFNMISNLFDAAVAKVTSLKDKIELSKFLAINLLRINSDGKTWFSLLSGNKVPSFEISNSLESLIQSTNQTIIALNSISEILQIQPLFDSCEITIESFLSLVTQLIKSKFQHWNLVGRLLLKKSINLLEPTNISLFRKEPELLDIAVRSPVLCEAALPMYVEYVDQLPKSFWKSYDPDAKLVFPISRESAKTILPNIISLCNGKSKQNYQEKVTLALLDLLDDDEIEVIVIEQIDKILSDETHATGGEQIISSLIKSSSSIAYEVLLHLTKISPKYEQNSAIKKIQNWISECSESGEIPVDDISKAIYSVIDHEYSSNASGKKKAEAYLSWAQKLLNKIQRNIPRNIFSKLSEKIINTGSRAAAMMIRQISNNE